MLYNVERQCNDGYVFLKKTNLALHHVHYLEGVDNPGDKLTALYLIASYMSYGRGLEKLA